MKKPQKLYIFLSLRLLLLSCSFVAVLWLRCQFKLASSSPYHYQNRPLLDRSDSKPNDREGVYDDRRGEEILERKARFIIPSMVSP